MALAKSFFLYALLPAFLKTSAFSTTTTKQQCSDFVSPYPIKSPDKNVATDSRDQIY